MYLTGGQFKGHKIETAKTAKPTLSKVRESVFNILNQYDLKDKKFLDMFSGSGIMALEALSRGYIVKAIEINPISAKTIKKNLEKLNSKAEIIICDALKFKNEKFNIIYLDPPWNDNYTQIIKKAYELLDKKGIIIVEHDSLKNIDIENIIKIEKLNLNIIKSKKYGRCLLDFLAN